MQKAITTLVMRIPKFRDAFLAHEKKKNKKISRMSKIQITQYCYKKWLRAVSDIAIRNFWSGLSHQRCSNSVCALQEKLYIFRFSAYNWCIC